MNRLKQITTKAKALYKSGKYAKWTDAIKAASKQTATVGATKKKAAKKSVKKVAKKKTAVKKAATKKKSAVKSYHKDTKSHNVRISEMSGSSQKATLMHLLREKEITENKLPSLKFFLKQETNPERKKHYKFWYNRYTKYLSGLKKQISEAKKHI